LNVYFSDATAEKRNRKSSLAVDRKRSEKSELADDKRREANRRTDERFLVVYLSFLKLSIIFFFFFSYFFFGA